MRKNIFAIILAALVLILIGSCTKKEKPVTSSEDWQLLPIGSSRDKLKTYSDHLGRNHYRDYIMLTWIEDQDLITKKITLTVDTLGGEFLTGLQEMPPLDEYETAPSSELATFLSITDKGDTAFYIFYEGGKIYTLQKGKQYYLGQDIFTTHIHMMTFTNAAFAMFEGDENLPVFDITESKSDTEDSSTSEFVREYSPFDYQVYYVANNYGDQGPPLLIENTENAGYILQVLSSSWNPVTIEPVFGSGQIIRLHNDHETLNFVIFNGYLINYQIAGDNIVFQTPEDFFYRLQFIATRELAYKLQS